MKNIEINTKAVKKIFAAGLLVLTMTGCGGNTEPVKDNKPTEEKTEETGKEQNDTELVYEKMTKEETEKLAVGDFIESKNGKVVKIPDQEVLESLGRDYEVEFGYLYGPVGGELSDFGESFCYYGDQIPTDTAPYQYEEEGKMMHAEYYIKGVHIIPIIESLVKDGVPSKVIQSTDGYTSTVPLIDPENYEKLPHTGEVSYSYVNKKATL